MNYYSHHIGDYRRDTSHLSLLEHGIYRQLLDQYYLNEQHIGQDDAKLMRLLCVRTADDVQAYKNVLSDFFVLTELGYIHKRCDVEIEVFHAKSRSASESAKARWTRKNKEKDADVMRSHENKIRSHESALPSDSVGNANHEPLTKNQEPLTNKRGGEEEIPQAQKSKVKAKRLTGSRLPSDWGLSEVDFQYCKQTRPELNPKDVFENFRDYWTAKAGDGAIKVDWSATWRSWVRKEKSPPKTTDVGFGEETVQQSMRREHIMGIGGGGTVWDKKIASAQIFSDLIDITPEVVQNVIIHSSH